MTSAASSRPSSAPPTVAIPGLDQAGAETLGGPAARAPLARALRGRRWWAVVLAAGVVSAMTAPGQTAGLSVFTDPLITALGVSRTALSLSYLVGTLLGAAVQPAVGRALDRWGVRTVALAVAGAFALVLFGLSFVDDIVGLTVGFVGVRMLGQGALSLAATTAVARAVHHRRGLALGVTGAMGSAGISLAPILIERLVARVGTGPGWRWEAAAVALVVIPLAFVLPRRPDRPGARRGQSRPVTTTPGPDQDWTLGEAARTGMFWVIAASLATSGMLSTGLAFHQIAILGEQGLTPLQAAANFLPQTLTGIVATLLAGALVDRVAARFFVVLAMATLAGALVMLPTVAPGWAAVAYGLVLGAAGGSLRGMEAASYVRYFGTIHIGAIRGVATSISLGSTALGPVALALGHDLTGTFTRPALVLAVIPVAVLVVGLVVRPPRRTSTAASR